VVDPDLRGDVDQAAGADHIGFKVENLDTFKSHVQDVPAAAATSRRCPLGATRKRSAQALLTASATGKYQMADPGGVWIDITDE